METLTSSKNKLKFKCPYCSQTYSRLQEMQPHIIAKHPEFVMDRETGLPPNWTKIPKTDSSGQTIEEPGKLSPEVKPEDSISDEIKQIEAERETLDAW